MQLQLYQETCLACSQVITHRYSTSFSLGIKSLGRRFRNPVYAIYGFVRYADEIVDTFHDFDKKKLLARFRADTAEAIQEGISLNPVLQAFQMVVRQYKIEFELIDAFLHSMEMDLYKDSYNQSGYETYIYGSAEVVGLMCLRVFCEGDETLYERLKEPARSLGKAFQKVNFLRDMKSDYFERGRVYFPGVDFQQFTPISKKEIESDIRADFAHAYTGIIQLPQGARRGVFLAYQYYLRLFRKITKLSPARVLKERIRVPDNQKLAIWVSTYFKDHLNFI
ncbi:MAG: phytoene/squalene synthase family protein [Bacteroidia bacterium]|nr:phytoene/squalene synthase family protein [Bacteroidia bacterium]